MRSLSDCVCAGLGKAETYMMVILNDELPMLFGGAAGPVSHLTLRAVGLKDESIQRLAGDLTGIMQTELGIESQRVYIVFMEADLRKWAWDGRACALIRATCLMRGPRVQEPGAGTLPRPHQHEVSHDRKKLRPEYRRRFVPHDPLRREQKVDVDHGFRNQAMSSPSMTLTYMFLTKDDLLSVPALPAQVKKQVRRSNALATIEVKDAKGGKQTAGIHLIWSSAKPCSKVESEAEMLEGIQIQGLSFLHGAFQDRDAERHSPHHGQEIPSSAE